MKIVLVEPGKEARPAEISGSLQSMQQLVGGIIQGHLSLDRSGGDDLSRRGEDTGSAL